MFSKQYRIKSNTLMKGSDKKKFKASVRNKFGEKLSDDAVDQLIPSKEDLYLSKIYTHSGESVLIYIHLNKKPLFFEIDNVLYPTVYTQWIHPNILQSFPTWDPVFKKIANGADLMLPGVVVDNNLGNKAYGNIIKGQPMSVNTVSNASAIGIGKAALSSEDMYMSGGRGKAINVLHCYGDHLWQSGTQQEPPSLGPPSGLEFLKNEIEGDGDDDDDESLESNNEEKEEEDGEEDQIIQNIDNKMKIEKEEKTIKSREEMVDSKITDEKLEATQVDQEEKLMTDTIDPIAKMDALLTEAFLTSWKTSAKKIPLPILTSNFFRLHMVQAVKPENLDVKKSSFKKLSKFLSLQSKAGIIKIKELTKGVESITSVDLNHESIKYHRVVKREQPTIESPSDELVEIHPCDEAYKAPVITELVLITDIVKPLFPGLSKGKGMNKSQVRTAVKDYVIKENLQNPNDKRHVTLDPILAGIVLGKGENSVLNLTWEEVYNRVIQKMPPGYSMEFPPKKGGSGGPIIIFQKGNVPTIEMTVATRSGNKKVTLIHNLDKFKIDPHEFSHKCQVGVAASSSVDLNPPNKKAGPEVLVQGNQTTFISKLLLNTYSLNKKYIIIHEKSKSKK